MAHPAIILMLWLIASTPALAQVETNGAATALSPLRKISEDIFQIGAVRLDKKTRTATFPAQVNMVAGNIEYLLVQASGKLHESILKPEAAPLHLHTAMLLLGAKGG